jgi:MraZ protein
MEFTGKHECKLDAKGRLLLPFRLKNKLPEGITELILAEGLDPYLALYTPEAWKSFVQRLISMDDLEDKNRMLKRTISAGTYEVELDSQGRILIPKITFAHAQLAAPADVLAVGVVDRIEFWNPQTYPQYAYADPAALSAAAKEAAKTNPHVPNNPSGNNFFLYRN